MDRFIADYLFSHSQMTQPLKSNMDRFIGGVLAPAQAHAVTFKIQYG